MDYYEGAAEKGELSYCCPDLEWDLKRISLLDLPGWTTGRADPTPYTHSPLRPGRRDLRSPCLLGIDRYQCQPRRYQSFIRRCSGRDREGGPRVLPIPLRPGLSPLHRPTRSPILPRIRLLPPRRHIVWRRRGGRDTSELLQSEGLFSEGGEGDVAFGFRCEWAGRGEEEDE